MENSYGKNDITNLSSITKKINKNIMVSFLIILVFFQPSDCFIVKLCTFAVHFGEDPSCRKR